MQISITPYFDAKFSILKNMGCGEYAEVWKVLELGSGAINAVKKSKLPFTGWDDRWQQLIEVEHLRCVRSSKYCVNMLNAWEERGYLYIQLELCSSGSLDKFIEFKQRKIPQDIVWKIFHEIVLGVRDIHQADVVHLDLKPSNILIDDEGYIKIGDFGISVHTPDVRWVKGEGDRRYMAPDLLREEFDKPADIFSLGLILLELATGIVLPGTGESWEMLRTGDFSKQKTALSKLSIEMQDMIAWLLTTARKNRPTIQDILEHAHFSQAPVHSQEQQSCLLSYVYEMQAIAAEQADRLEQRNNFSTPEGRII
ncbi:kinase-like domain-containing protein [Mucor mucedo]|uniref:kinase-like domain-containing protein n=1 Tax=Mucor mucedo TaxID=29922 RepID=UPI00221FB7A7|nr:kinase-like domain-containing protein [Mucor mucedo]KAI7888510.1 kinase-like domain-containing protein [Mucor mucedo]